jgi:hypothetical protein
MLVTRLFCMQFGYVILLSTICFFFSSIFSTDVLCMCHNKYNYSDCFRSPFIFHLLSNYSQILSKRSESQKSTNFVNTKHDYQMFNLYTVVSQL